MISKTLFGREVKANYKIILIFMAVITMYCSMIIAMFDPKLGESLNMMAESMPDLFAAFGMANVGSTLIEFAANYLYGFILLAIPIICIILLGNRLIGRYIDKGSMAYLLATPNKRRKIILTQGVFMALSILVLVVYATVLCIVVSGAMFPGELDIKKFIMLNIGLYGLLFFIGGICFLSSCIFNDTRYSMGIGGGLAIAFILLQMVSQVGDKFEALKYATPLTLFQVDKIISGESSAVGCFLILYIVGIVFYAIGVQVFSKRDLSL